MGAPGRAVLETASEAAPQTGEQAEAGQLRLASGSIFLPGFAGRENLTHLMGIQGVKFSSIAFAWVLSITLVGGQSIAGRGPMAEDVFTNVQILRGIPVDQFMGTMAFFSAATGMNCTDCHVEESGGSWAKYADDNTYKRTARRMMLMVTEINRTNFGGRQVVTCNTCHRGSTKPNVMPSIALLYGTPPPDEPGDFFVQAPGQPRAEQLLDKFIEAIGGAQRVGALTSFTAKGTHMAFDDAEPSPMEFYARAPNQRTAIIHTPAGDSIHVLDGTGAWIAAPEEERPVPLLTITGQDLDGIRLETELFFPARIKQALENWRVGPPAVVDDRELLLVQGTTGGGATATLAFDAETGLLTRLIRYSESPVGRLVMQVDYSDYREVAGVKIPHRWTTSWLGGRSKYELTSVQANTAIDPARFARPNPAPRPAR
jgi:outer membrane lipoprotein-sorting protein